MYMGKALANKYQRMLKLKIIKKHFDSLQFEYFPSRDVYEVYHKGKMIHAVMAYRNAQEIINEIKMKREKIFWRNL